MTSHFIANGLYLETEIKDYIMNCDSKYHKEVYEAIVSYSKDTTQTILPFAEWVNEQNPDLHVIGPLTQGDYIRESINNDYYGENDE